MNWAPPRQTSPSTVKKKEDEKDFRTVWRVRYGKNIVETGTNVTIAGYRYSTRGFNTLSEVLDSYSNDGSYTSRSLRNRTNLTLNQSTGKGLGSLSISGLIEDYWDDKRTNKSISVGYNGGFRNVNYYLGYSYNRYTRAEITLVRMLRTISASL